MKIWIGLALFMMGCAENSATDSYEQTMARYRQDQADQIAQVQRSQEAANEALKQKVDAYARAYQTHEEQKKPLDPRLVAQLQQQHEQADADKQCQTVVGCEEQKSACLHYLQKQNAEKNIAAEERNPSGVVSLVDLHDWGNMARAEDEMFQADKASYEKVSGQKFNARTCAELVHN